MAVGSRTPEKPMEARIARLESDVAHIRSDVAEIKTDVRALRERIDTRIDRLESKVDGNSLWAVSLQLGIAAGLLGAMARGFGWL